MIIIMSEKRLAFRAEWYDVQSSVVRKLTLFYYPVDSTIEINQTLPEKEVKFLRKTSTTLGPGEFFPGNVLNIFAKQIRILEFADSHTQLKV